MKFRVKGIKIPKERYKVLQKELNLYPHQIELIKKWNSYHSFVVSTPTGSGKTAAALLPLIENSEKAIFVYPTNALLRNQLISFCKIIGEWLDLKFYIMSFTESPFSDLDIDLKYEKNHSPLYTEADIRIAIIDGDFLEQLAGKQPKGEALYQILSFKPDFILTNPDTLFSLFALKYARAMESLQDILDFQNIVVDEFHMYSGIELSNMFYLLKFAEELMGPFKKKIFLSATFSKEVPQRLERFFGKTCEIDMELADEGDDAVKDVVVELGLYEPSRGRKESDYSVEEEIIRRIRDIINDLENTKNENTGIVPCVIIVDSVIQARSIENRIEREFGIKVSSYRGLMDKKTREKELKKAIILVGTSAIEVGIDFDCKYLIMEAEDASSFIQRFGRAGRHREGSITIFSEYFRSKMLEKRIDQDSVLKREEFLNIILETYPIKDSYAWFMDTKYGLLTAKILSEAFVKKIESSKMDKMNISELKKKIYDSFEKIRGIVGVDEFEINIELRKYRDVLMKNFNFRSSMPSADVFDMEEFNRGRTGLYSAEIMTLLRRGMPLGDAKGCVLKNKAKIGEAYLQKILKTTSHKKIYFVNSYKGKYNIWAEIVDSDKFGIENLNHLHINTKGDKDWEIRMNLRGRENVPEVNEYFYNQLYIVVDSCTYQKLDWRIQALQLKDNRFEDKYVVFGSNALLCKAFIDRFSNSLQ